MLSGLLQAVQSQRSLSPEQVSTGISFAESERKRCFALEEEDAPRAQWLIPFSAAHLALALVTAFGPQSHDDAAAIYELIKTQDHGSPLERFLDAEITAGEAQSATKEAKA